MVKKLFANFIILAWFISSMNISALAQHKDDSQYSYNLEDFLGVNQINLESINYNYVYDIISDNYNELQKITVAIIDTGVDITHPNLKDNIIEGYNFVDDSPEMYDDSGHGTLLAGVISGKHTGIAHGVKIMPIKVLDKYGFGKSENLVKGILWAVDNGADIINISIGRNRDIVDGDVVVYETFSDIEYRAIEYALMNNVTVVLPSGNFKMNELSYPAAYLYKQTIPKPIIVSGFDNEEKFFWSNTSHLIDVSAPADNILSLIPKELDYNITDYYNIDYDGYSFCGGTSFSCAYVSAMAAIIKSFDYELTNEQIRQIIVSSAKDIGDEGKDEEFGYGKIDLRKSLFMQRLAAEPNKNNIIEGDYVVFKTQLTNMKNENVDFVEKYHDFDEGLITIEDDDIDNLMDIIKQKEIELEKEREMEMEFEKDLRVNVYRYYSYQDTFILEDSHLFNMDIPEIICEIPFETSGVYKIVFFSPSNLWIPFNYYLKVKPQNPTSSLKEGYYFGKRQLELLVETSEADIYYTTNEIPILHNNEISPLAKRFDDDLIINKSLKLNIVSEKNGVISDVVKFKYHVISFFMAVLGLLVVIMVIAGLIIVKKSK